MIVNCYQKINSSHNYGMNPCGANPIIAIVAIRRHMSVGDTFGFLLISPLTLIVLTWHDAHNVSVNPKLGPQLAMYYNVRL